jgi:antitoxin (DNA-binding transcriptional repressor) of toxin-antitoxin stability system
MKQIGVEGTDLESCVRQAQQGRLVVTRKGKPVALVVGVQGLSAEQLELGTSEKFWKLIAKRREQRTMSRASLEQGIRAGRQRRESPNEALQRTAQKRRRR